MGNGRGHSHDHDTTDPWETVDANTYSPDQVYTRSVDGRGHSVNTQTKMSPEIAGEIAALVASGVVPEYRTAQDFHRDAAIHRLKYWADREGAGGLERRLTIEMIRSKTEQALTEMTELQEMVDAKTRAIDAATKLEDWDHLARIIDAAEDEAEVIREPYRGKLMKVVEKAKSALKAGTKKGA